MHIPQLGDRYRHFKGNEYEIIAVTVGSSEISNKFSPDWEGFAIHTETGEDVEVLGDGLTFIALIEGRPITHQMVVYKSVNVDEDVNGEIWARPLDNFCDVLCNGKPVVPVEGNGWSTMYYRFQKL